MVIFAISLVIAGAALASLGVLRLTRAALTTMPRSTAAAVIVAGAAVATFGSLLPRITQREAPAITLERQQDGATPTAIPISDIRGSVQTPDGKPVSRARVVLHAGARKPQETRSAADGSYTFRRLPIGGPYRMAVSFRGGTFLKVLHLPSAPVTTTVARTTTRPANITVRVASLAIVGDGRGVQAVYAATIENGGRTAYIGGVPLPIVPGAIAVEPRAGFDRSEVGVQDGVLFSSAPVLPGETAISFTYAAPMRERGLDFVVDAAFPTSRLDLLVAGGLRVDDAARPNGSVRLGGRTYERYTWRGLKAGETISTRVAASSRIPLIRTVAIVAGGIVAAVIVVFPLVRRRRTPIATTEPVIAN